MSGIFGSSPDVYSEKSVSEEEGTEEVKKEIEAREKIIDINVELLLSERAEKINEGNYGLIFKVELEKIPPELVRALKEMKGVDLAEGPAIKLLKVYERGRGRREFRMQQKASEIISGAADKKGLALVPKPLFFRDLPISPQTQKVLEQNGMRRSDRAEAIFMDLVPGEDIATILFKEVLRRHSGSVHLGEREIRAMVTGELQAEVGRALEFRKPGGKKRLEEERAFESEAVKAENAKKIISFLKKAGFILHPDILSQMKKTMALFHEAGFCHRDGHERNFMVVGDHELKEDVTPPQVYVVDFANAISFKGSYQDARESVYRKSEREVYPQDEEAINRLETLTLSFKDERKAEVDKFMQSILSMKVRLDKLPAERLAKDSPEWREAYGGAVERAENTNESLEFAFRRFFLDTKPDSRRIERFIVLLLKMEEENRLGREDIRAFLRLKLGRELKPEVRAQFVKLLESL